MLDSLYISATGMVAQQFNVDTISNNLANINTTAYKRSRVSFEDLLYREVGRNAGALLGGEAPARFGAGAAVSDTTKIFADGELRQTQGPLDVAIRGNGFFEVLLPDGSRAFTRNGALRVTNEGLLASGDGHVLAPGLRVPTEATQVTIDPTGLVSAQVPNETAPVEVGQIELARFVNPGGLSPLGTNLYLATEKSGDALLAKPGEEGMGTLQQGFLEASNVRLTDELVGLVLAQRAFEVNARAIQASDEMLSLVNNLRR
jgi:flagellar basal-body rod protein FlgG